MEVLVGLFLLVAVLAFVGWVVYSVGFEKGQGTLLKPSKGRIYEKVEVFRFRSSPKNEWEYYCIPPGLGGDKKELPKYYLDPNYEDNVLVSAAKE